MKKSLEIIIVLSITVILITLTIVWNLKKNNIETKKINSNDTVSIQENIRGAEEMPAKNSEQNTAEKTETIPAKESSNIIQSPPAPASSNTNPLIVANTKNSIGISTRDGYNLAINLLKNKGHFELRDMIFTKYYSEPDKDKNLILFTFYLSDRNRGIRIKYYTKKNKAVLDLECSLNKPKECALSDILKQTLIPQVAVDFGFERAIAKIETNEDYLKITNKISNFPWVSFHNSPYGWEFQTMIDVKGINNNKEQYSFSVNLDKKQVFFERRL